MLFRSMKIQLWFEEGELIYSDKLEPDGYWINLIKLSDQMSVKDPIPFFSWSGRVDGKDIIIIKSHSFSIEHLSFNPISEIQSQFYNSYPEEPTQVELSCESCRGQVAVFEQPAQENDYKISIIVDDNDYEGDSRYAFTLYHHIN